MRQGSNGGNKRTTLINEKAPAMIRICHKPKRPLRNEDEHRKVKEVRHALRRSKILTAIVL